MTTTKITENSVEPSNSDIYISPKKTWANLELAIIFLALLSLAGQCIKYLTVYDEAFGLIPMVYMGKSLSLPTIFFVLLYFIIFNLLSVITAIKVAIKDRHKRSLPLSLVRSGYFLSLPGF